MNKYSLLKHFALPISLVSIIIMSGCDSSGSSSNGAAGQYSMNVSGANGGADAGIGSAARYIDISKYSNGDLNVLHTGSADAGFTMQSPNGNLGDVPLIITTDTTIDVFNIGNTRPAAGVAYFIQNDFRLYLSPGGGTIIGGGDAADGQIVSGIQVDNGATLTLGLAYTSYAFINIVNDVINHGSITTEDFDTLNRGDLRLYVSSYIADGGISLQGTLPGQNGGYLYFSGSTFFNSGDVSTYGANDDASNDAGDGNSIELYAGYFGQNSGDLNSSGGNASTASNMAGSAGYINISGGWGYVHNSGNLTARGGNGDLAGNGHAVFLQANSGASAELLNSGDIDTSGGTASAGNGGTAGDAGIVAYGGRLVNNAAIITRGGATTNATFNGGSAGNIEISHDESYWYDSSSPAIDTLISGNFDSRGGDAVANGSGDAGASGYIEINQNNTSEPEVNARMELLGYTDFMLNGGDGNQASTGGSFYIYQDWSDTTATHGDVLNEVTITANGGNVSSGATTAPFSASRGGYAYISTAYNNGSLNDSIKKAKNTGDFTANGGSGSVDLSSNTTTRSGNMIMYGYNGAENSGTIQISGGDDSGTDGGTTGYGGYASYIEIASDNGIAKNTGDVIASGGDGEYDGGNAGGIGIYGIDAINTGDITANGGNADATLTDSRGGNGGWIELSSPTGDASMSGTTSLTGGTGDNSLYGKDGRIMVGGFCTGPAC